jgi:hypothetical protein
MPHWWPCSTPTPTPDHHWPIPATTDQHWSTSAVSHAFWGVSQAFHAFLYVRFSRFRRFFSRRFPSECLLGSRSGEGRGHISTSFHLERSNKGPLESSCQGAHDRAITPKSTFCVKVRFCFGVVAPSKVLKVYLDAHKCTRPRSTSFYENPYGVHKILKCARSLI